MKRKSLIITTMIVCIFTGCTKTTNSEIENEIDTFISTSIEEISASSVSIEETLSSSTEEVVCLDQKIFENGEPIQSISLLQKGSEQPRLFVKITDKEEVYFDFFENAYPHYFLNIYFADLNQDGIEEVIVECSMGYFPAILIIDVANLSYLDPPYIVEAPGLGIKYKVYAVDEEHVQIKGGDFDSIIELSYDEIWDWNNDGIQTKEEYFARYKEEAPEIGFAEEVSYSGIEVVNYNNRSCLKLKQYLCGAWGKNDYLGLMETIVSWDSDGEYHIENVEYLKKAPFSMSKSEDKESSESE